MVTNSQINFIKTNNSIIKLGGCYLYILNIAFLTLEFERAHTKHPIRRNLTVFTKTYK